MPCPEVDAGGPGDEDGADEVHEQAEVEQREEDAGHDPEEINKS